MSTNYFIVYRNNLDRHKERGEVNYLDMAFADTANAMALNEKIPLSRAIRFMDDIAKVSDSGKTATLA